jgi:prepilin-type N-terminal cleavage/methylation domain-containing protein
MHSKRDRRGMTLIEVLVIIAIIGVLIALVGGAVGGCGGTSDGTRIGYLRKFSHKTGTLGFSSWEGGIVQEGFGAGQLKGRPGQSGSQITDVWYFSVLEGDAGGIGRVVGPDGKGTYTVAVYYRGDAGEWKHCDNYEAAAGSAAEAKTKALDALEDTRIDGWKAEVLNFIPADAEDEEAPTMDSVTELLSVINQIQHLYMDIEDVYARNISKAEKLRMIAEINLKIGTLCAEALPG